MAKMPNYYKVSIDGLNVNLEPIYEELVEVVRCKDCANFERKFPGYGYCYHWDYEQGMSPNEVEDNDFCSYGERRTDNERKAD